MGQKVSPVGLRVGVIRNWDAKWYADKKNVPALLKEDIDIRKFLKTTFKNAAVSQIEIERLKGKTKDRVKVTLHTGKPGVVIGRDAENKNKAVKTLEYMTKKEIILNVVEVKRVEQNAELVAQSIAEQLENRASFRRVQKIAMQRALKSGAKGVKTLVSGRLGGAEIARSEGYSEGRVPLHTLRADIDYATAEATTTYGKLGVKVWIYKGEVLPGQKVRSEAQPRREKRSKGGK
ncbi:MAG: 30S ribosomal protein S3 [Tenericutes bacterium HGW-Tenericutes-8]|nr:MAG: 30S ribosomal protein S3 [Tenericutes bacterium HGW-Tenericutes-8]